jgi:hypothetical protein
MLVGWLSVKSNLSCSSTSRTSPSISVVETSPYPLLRSFHLAVMGFRITWYRDAMVVMWIFGCLLGR